MERISKYSRLRTTAVAAFVASGLVLMAMFASASASPGIKKISLGIRNSSLTPIRVQFCRNGHARYPTKTNPKTCHQIEGTYVIAPGQSHAIPNSNPVGVILTSECRPGYFPCPDNRELNFYAGNGGFFYPFFITNNDHISLSDNQHVLGSQQMIKYELRRYADEDRDGENVKLMRIEIRQWATKPSCQPRPGLPAGGC